MTLKHCLCSICSQCTFLDANGVSQEGQLVNFHTFQRHAARSRREGADLDLSDHIGCAIVSRTLERGSDQPEQSLAVRITDIYSATSRNRQPHESSSASQLTSAGSSVPQIEGCCTKGNVDGYRTISTINSELDLRGRFFKPNVFPSLFFSAVHSLQGSPDDVQVQPTSVNNERYISHLGWLTVSRHVIQAIEDAGDADLRGRRNHLLDSINKEITIMKAEKESQWRLHRFLNVAEAQCTDHNRRVPRTIDVDHLRKPSKLKDPIYMIATFLVIILHVLAGLSRMECRFIFIALRVAIFTAFQFCGPTISSAQQAVLDDIPRDIRTALNFFNLKPEVVRYACCPSCFATYLPDPSSNQYQACCSFRETPDQPPCGARLLRDATGTSTSSRQPVRAFGYQPVSSWLARLFSRPDIESQMSQMEKAWSAMSVDGVQHDIWDAKGLHELRGPDGRLFSIQPPGSIHLVFGLFVDWFNPYTNKQAGKSHSTGAMYMVCLNLPRSVRFKLENVYLVGVIPGPKEPSLAQMNHLLRPLVDDLLCLWEDGVKLRSTRWRRGGCLIRCALGPLICDIPALRKTAGFAGHGSTYLCSFCCLHAKHIRNLEKASWPRNTWAEHLALATCWRDADSVEERQEIFKLTGIRWSELLRLRYWDPTKFALLDAMHNLFLGELQHHCREVWGISVKTPNASPKRDPHPPERQAAELERARKAIKNMSTKELSTVRKGYISAIARLNDVVPTSTLKRDYVLSLVEWFRLNPSVTIKLPSVLDRPVADFVMSNDDVSDLSAFTVLSAELLHIIRADIAGTTLPSWLTRPPHTFGSPSHGKLSADQWRCVCTVNLVITLVREWSSSSSSSRDKLLLGNFVDLIVAVDMATRRSISRDRIAAYTFYINRYLESLATLFEQHSLVPNHHLSLHLDECLTLFGPVHSWWSFPFERYNGLMQKLNTNYRPGDIELTFLEHFSIGSNLRIVAEELEWPPLKEYEEMMREFRSTFSTPTRGSLLENIAPVDEPSTSLDASKVEVLDEDNYQQLLARINHDIPDPTARYARWSAHGSPLLILSLAVQRVRSVKMAGVEYASPGRSSGNSFVLVNLADPFRDGEKALVPAQIKTVFLHSRRLRDGTDHVEPFFVVRTYTLLSVLRFPILSFSFTMY